jgi:hypothetical protein
MSWWETGSERLKIGDVPADKIGEGVKRLVAKKQQKGAAAPTLPQLIAALEHAMKSKGGGRIVANTSTGVVSAGDDDPDVTSEIDEIVTAVANSYLLELERDASPAEILACFDFVLGNEPARYLSGMEGQEIHDIGFGSVSSSGTSAEEKPT